MAAAVEAGNKPLIKAENAEFGAVDGTSPPDAAVMKALTALLSGTKSVKAVAVLLNAPPKPDLVMILLNKLSVGVAANVPTILKPVCGSRAFAFGSGNSCRSLLQELSMNAAAVKIRKTPDLNFVNIESMLIILEFKNVFLLVQVVTKAYII